MKLLKMLLALLLLCFAGLPSDAAPTVKPVRVGYLAPLSGSLRDRSEEILLGIRAAVDLWSGNWRMADRTIEIVAFDMRDRKASTKRLESEIRSAKVHLLVAAPAGEDLEQVTGVLRRLGIPAVLATPWEPRLSPDPADPVFFFGGNTVDQALLAAGYSEIPLKAVHLAALHDGSAPSRGLGEAYLRNRMPRARVGETKRIPDTPEEVLGLLAGLVDTGVDLAFVCGDVDSAIRVASCEGERPALLFADGLLTPAVVAHARAEDRFLVGINPWIVDGEPDRYRITREEEGKAPSPLGVRGYAAVTLGLKALRESKGGSVGAIGQMRALCYESMVGQTIFSEWGQARFFRYELWEVREGKAVRIKPTYLPTQDVGLLLRAMPSSRFALDPGSMMVLVTWGGEKERSIEKDLTSIGLSSRGYEGNIDEMVLDGVLGRALSRLNRLFWRNADGSPIPGVSFNITFGTKLPKGVKRQQWWEIRIAGDDPVAGGRAMGSLALVYSTFIERTMYRGFRLDPGVCREDLDFFTGQYEWGSALEKNLRNDDIRALIEGFSGALAMTGAHELGHLAGLSHDTSSDRSIMNVEEGGGLEPDWAHWVPEHIKLLETRLKRDGEHRGRKRRR